MNVFDDDDLELHRDWIPFFSLEFGRAPFWDSVAAVFRKKYDEGRQTEYQRLNDIAHMYQALKAANSWSGHIRALLK